MLLSVMISCTVLSVRPFGRERFQHKIVHIHDSGIWSSQAMVFEKRLLFFNDHLLSTQANNQTFRDVGSNPHLI